MTPALKTPLRIGGIQGFGWRDIDMIERVMTVQKSKTKAGLRLIPLNNQALRAILQLRERAKALLGGSPLSDWYVFPHAEGATKPDPTRPMSSWRTAWRRLTRE